MDDRQRFLGSIRGEPIDRFFRYEHGMRPSTRLRWLGEGLPEEVGCYPDQPGFNDYFEMDSITRIQINSGYCDSPYCPRFEVETIEETSEHRLFIDSNGIGRRELVSGNDTSMPQFMSYPMSSRADWEIIKERLNPGAAKQRIGQPADLIAQCADDTRPTMLPMCGVFGHPRNLLGDEGLAYVQYDDPALLDEILENWCELYCSLISEVTELVRVDSVLIWEDMCYKGGPLISPRTFADKMLPHYRQFVSHARERGVEDMRRQRRRHPAAYSAVH